MRLFLFHVGILQGVYWGLGLGTGSILGGHFIHTLGPHWTFRAAATGSFVIASLFAITQWKWKRADLDDSLGIYHYFSAGESRDTEALLQEDTTDATIKNTKTKNDTKTKDHRKEAKRKDKIDKHEKTYKKLENPH